MRWTPPEAPCALEKHHRTAEFESGAAELDSWLKDYGWVNHASGNARVFVAAREDVVLGYYALATAGVAREEAPTAITKGGVPTQVPVLLLARLAVDRSAQGHRIGRGLLADAILRAARIGEDIGFRALLVHARDDEARRFYRQNAGFEDSPTDPLHLYLPLKEIRRTAGGS